MKKPSERYAELACARPHAAVSDRLLQIMDELHAELPVVESKPEPWPGKNFEQARTVAREILGPDWKECDSGFSAPDQPAIEDGGKDPQDWVAFGRNTGECQTRETWEAACRRVLQRYEARMDAAALPPIGSYIQWHDDVYRVTEHLRSEVRGVCVKSHTVKIGVFGLFSRSMLRMDCCKTGVQWAPPEPRWTAERARELCRKLLPGWQERPMGFYAPDDVAGNSKFGCYSPEVVWIAGLIKPEPAVRAACARALRLYAERIEVGK